MKTTLAELIFALVIAIAILSCSKSTEPQTCANPVFSQSSGTYNNELYVTIGCETPGVVIRYTTNGSDPTESSNQYNSGITINTTTTLKAKAYKSGWNPSPTTSATYTISSPPPGQMIYVPGGTFHNGTSNVTVSSFYIDKYEVTQAGYQAVMGTNPSYFSSVTNGPVEQVSWFNAIEYCNRRSLQEGLTPCYSYSTYGTNPDSWPSGWNTDNANHTNVSCNWTANSYRLPTEMEWEYAARGGLQTHGYTYSGSNDLNSVGWYWDNWGASTNSTHTVGALAPNELGIFDMSGNVWEWTWDIYGSYPSGSQNNPTGASSGSYRVFRGGSWSTDANFCTVSDRSCSDAPGSGNIVGFRCVRRVSP